MADSPAQKRKWSLKKKLLIFVVAPLLLLVGVALILDAMANKRLQTALHEAREDGGPVTFKELEAARKVWPDDQNGAKVIMALILRLDELSKDPAIKVLPHFSEKPTPLLGSRLAPADLDAAEAELKLLAPELAEIDRLQKFQGGQFPVTIASNPIETLLPNLAPLRTSARLKASQAECQAMRGDTSALVDDVTLIRRHAQLVSEDPFIISDLVGIAIENLAVDTIERSMGLASPPPEQLKRLDDLLATMEGKDRLSWGMRGERASFIGTTEYVRANGWAAVNAIMDVGGGPSGSPPPAPGWSNGIPGLRGFLMQDETTGLSLYNRMVAVSKKPKEARTVFKQIEHEIAALPAYKPLTRMLTPALSRVFDLDQRLEANIRAARAGLAVERYRQDTGRFPASLDELVPKYLPRVPLDPFDDKPLRYLVDQYGVVIYSISDDLKDDGGQVASRQPDRSKQTDCGFSLLPMELRGRPATQPASEPASEPSGETAEEKAERLRRFREGDR